MPGTSPLPSGLNSWTGRMTSIPFVSRRRHRHRVDKSLPGRHSRPADAERECRHLPTRPACRHCRRQMPTVRAPHRGVGISDSWVGMSRRCASRSPSVTRSAVSVTMAVACMVVSSTWAGARPAAFLPFFRHARTCSTAVRFNFGTGSVPTGGTVSAPLLSPRIKSGVTTGGQGRRGDAGAANFASRSARSVGNLRYTGRSPGPPKLNRTAVDLFRA